MISLKFLSLCLVMFVADVFSYLKPQFKNLLLIFLFLNYVIHAKLSAFGTFRFKSEDANSSHSETVQPYFFVTEHSSLFKY